MGTARQHTPLALTPSKTDALSSKSCIPCGNQRPMTIPMECSPKWDLLAGENGFGSVFLRRSLCFDTSFLSPLACGQTLTVRSIVHHNQRLTPSTNQNILALRMTWPFQLQDDSWVEPMCWDVQICATKAGEDTMMYSPTKQTKKMMMIEGLEVIREDNNDGERSQAATEKQNESEKVFRRLVLVSRTIVVLVLLVSAATIAFSANKLLSKDESDDFSDAVSSSSLHTLCLY